MVDIQRLKSSTDAESEDALLFIKEDARQFCDCAITRIRIICVNQAKRHIDDRHLETELKSDT